ncbi:MAG: hypothetical protein HGB34_03870 [Candidatus Moranbacteria bacterium]|nr:hypothetical protein [Candidatus Moranbacteria bacterium]
MIQFKASKTRIVALLMVLLVGVALVFLSVRTVLERSNGSAEAVQEADMSTREAQQTVVSTDGKVKITGLLGEDIAPPPPAPSMERMKTQGCVADGLLNGDFPGDGKTIKLINRSNCYYLHRAVETWLEPPDFDEIGKNIAELKDGFLIGMFLAEAIDTKANYEYPFEGRDFDFARMCRPGSKNFWGEHTCKPTLASAEYRTYLRYITRRAMDRGVQVFMFGQVYLQDTNDLSKSPIREVIAEMHEYAAYHGMEIFVGAQTNDIEDAEYLANFDFIEGGVGLSSEGRVEDGPCFSRWWKKEGDWCWALLWHDRFAKKAKNVLVHYDWSGKIGDDMSIFTRMDEASRHETTARLYRYFTSKGVGFLIPYLSRLHVDNGGCVGPAKRYYTPDDRFSCDDEDAWNKILKSESR